MPVRDTIHHAVKQALINDGWKITDDPYVIVFGERFLFVDLGAEEEHQPDPLATSLVGAERDGTQIAVEIKELRGQSVIIELEQAVGQYVLYRLVLNQVDPDRGVYLAIPESTYRELFAEPIGELVVRDLPLQLLVVDLQEEVVKRWIPTRPIERS